MYFFFSAVLYNTRFYIGGCQGLLVTVLKEEEREGEHGLDS